MSSEPHQSAPPPIGSPPARADSDSDILSSLFRPPVVVVPNSQHLSLEDLRNAVHSRTSGNRVAAVKARSPNTSSPKPTSIPLLEGSIKEDLDVDSRSPNSSVTLETVTPSSTPEISRPSIGALDSSSELELPPSSMRSVRELPWVEKHILGKTSPRSGGDKVSTEARIQALDGLSSLPRRDSGNTDPNTSITLPSPDIHLPTIHRLPTEEMLPATPPLTPVIDSDSEDEEIVSLRAAIASSLQALRSNTFASLKSILKPTMSPFVTIIERSNSSFSGLLPSGSSLRSSVQSQSVLHINSATNSLSTDQSSVETVEMVALPLASSSPSVGDSEVGHLVSKVPKKSVRWNLSEDQELRERQKPQGPSSPGKLHRGNCLIFADDSPDELMSVCSDDGPTPPLSPNTSTDDYFSLYDMKRDSLPSGSFPNPSYPSALHHSQNESSMNNLSTSSSTSSQISPHGKVPISSSSTGPHPVTSLSFGSPRIRTAVSTQSDGETMISGGEKGKNVSSGVPSSPHSMNTSESGTKAAQWCDLMAQMATKSQPTSITRSNGLPSLTRSSSIQTLPSPSVIQDFGGGTNNVRTNTRANALIGTLNDPHEMGSLPSREGSLSHLQRSRSDFQSSPMLRNSKKRQRAQQGQGEYDDSLLSDAQIPQEKKWLSL